MPRFAPPPPTARRRRRAPHGPRGFSLAEVVVAIVLLAIAALGVASTSTVVARLAATSRAVALATRETARVVDSLRAIPCRALGAGSATTAAGVVHWSVAAPIGTRRVHAVLAPASPRVPRAVVEAAIVPCD
ncbi:MAG TPA: prepilin-type N-terminal cleavage/methylation domain-containing protein [Gemmatimonadaceae bacterium]|nr:prepilin-type N-terminal cleavage/methylation domain-containing protein [Gemmatimonadaceae bacterium]